MSTELVWVIVAIAAIVIVALLVIGAIMRGRRKPFETRPIPADLVSTYEGRIPEIEQMFVNQPREAVAAAKMLVDDMLTRMGYPARMNGAERVRDVRLVHREHADRYRMGATLKNDATTEELRRALRGQVEMARELINDARKTHRVPEAGERGQGRELAG